MLPLNFNVNSGLYLARASERTIKAFRAIIKYGEKIRQSEQKAFNYVLCGAFKNTIMGPGLRVGASRCLYRHANTTSRMLPPEQFPNGSDEDLWQIKAGTWSKQRPRVVAVHTNYLTGLSRKMERIRTAGFWIYDRMSQHPDGCSAVK